MLPELSSDRALAAFLVLAEFACLTVLGMLLVQMMQWESRFNNGKSGWLLKLRRDVSRLRALRRKLDKLDGEWPQIPLFPKLRGKWRVIPWLFKAVSAAKWARS